MSRETVCEWRLCLFQCGELHVDDQLVLVQEHSLVGVTYQKAIELLRMYKGSVQLTVNQCTSSTPAAASANQNATSSETPVCDGQDQNQSQTSTEAVTSLETNQNQDSKRDSIQTDQILPSTCESVQAANSQHSQGKYETS